MVEEYPDYMPLQLPEVDPIFCCTIVRWTKNQVWFGFSERSPFVWLFFGGAFIVVVLALLALFGPKDDVIGLSTILIGAGLSVAALVGIGIYVMRRSPLVGMIDLKEKRFSILHSRRASPILSYPIRDMVLYLRQRPLTGDPPETELGFIDVIGPEYDSCAKGRKKNTVTIFGPADNSTLLKAAHALDRAVSWKAVEGDDHLLDLWKQHC